jgi:hypothetical protein
MIHSGFGIDQFPDCHLRDIAHSGMDAILVFTKDVNTTTCGFLDFNELIVRAAKYGIDVYAYSYMKSKFHPLDDGAEAFYESTYGRLFEKCPGLKGIVLVGESVGFPSRDPMVNRKNSDLSSRFWPCNDYPEWLECIKKTVRRYNEKADIVLFGHTHMPESIYKDGIYYFNPGSLKEGCYGVVDITDNGIICINKKL